MDDRHRSIWLLLAASVVVGTGQGSASLGGMTEINTAAPPDRHAEVLSGFYVVIYLGTAIPVVGVGFLAAAMGLLPAVEWFSAGAAAAAIALLGALRRRPSSPGADDCPEVSPGHLAPRATNAAKPPTSRVPDERGPSRRRLRRPPRRRNAPRSGQPHATTTSRSRMAHRTPDPERPAPHRRPRPPARRSRRRHRRQPPRHGPRRHRCGARVLFALQSASKPSAATPASSSTGTAASPRPPAPRPCSSSSTTGTASSPTKVPPPGPSSSRQDQISTPATPTPCDAPATLVRDTSRHLPASRLSSAAQQALCTNPRAEPGHHEAVARGVRKTAEVTPTASTPSP
jgi:hypothetical protein